MVKNSFLILGKNPATVPLLTTLLISCQKPTPTSHEKNNDSQPLAAAQLTLAKNHLHTFSPEKALPYLQASIENHPSQEAKNLLIKSLATIPFSVPSYTLEHPFPILHQAYSENTLFLAIAGSHPTVIRWDLTATPQVSAILFPTDAQGITHLSLSPTATRIIVHRDDINLLCEAENLKPITNLGSFPENLDPDALQPFSENSLFLATPTLSGDTLSWQIRETTTGEILRTETLPLYPKPINASLRKTTLLVTLENLEVVHIPISGQTSRTTAEGLPPLKPDPTTPFSIKGAQATSHFTIPKTQNLPHDSTTIAALSGYHLNPETQSLTKTPTESRLQHLSKLIPLIPATQTNYSAQTPLEQRLAAAYPHTYPDLKASEITLTNTVCEIFASKEPAAISAIISSLPPQGLPTATALHLSLKLGNPTYISKTLSIAQNLPPALAKLGTTPLTPESLATLRKEQDWLGYESPDFTDILPLIQRQKATTLTELTLPQNPTEQEIQALIGQLLTPALQQKFPRETLAATAIANATILASSEETATSALQLTAVAQRLGTPPAEVLRTNALALTSLEDFKAAHRTWLDLITNQPQTSHHPSDYSEASYTAFENVEPQQAMEILRTGIFRFPNDVALAIRASWIALVTDHPEEAATYLAKASTLGIPGNQVEETTILLTIANVQLSNITEAEAHLAQLQAINPAWKDPKTLEALPYPETLKASLRQLLWQP